MSDDAAEWIRSRPPQIQAVMRKFPPFCEVTSDGFYSIPGAMSNGVVMSYLEDGTVRVRDGFQCDGMCDPAHLRVVKCQPGIGPEDVAAVLDRG